jgi:hypothetical protein
MVRVEKPQVAEEAKPFFTEDELAALLNAIRGQDFETHDDGRRIQAGWWSPVLRC